ncbi:MAG: hypothetical protein KAI24_13970 [Planctomycetes bacterium]|nr:hypothetical protein [Planctomycetota bacterium]
MTFLLANAVVATVLAAIVCLLGRALRPSPAVMHGLWLVVLLKLVTPPLFEIPIDTSWWSAQSTAAAPATDHAAAPASPAAPRLRADDVLTVHPLPPPTDPAAAGALERTLLLGWLAASSLLLVVAAVGSVRGGRRIRALAPAPAWLRGAVEDLARTFGVQVPELRDDPTAAGPYIWTLGRTRLVLPVARLAQQSERGRAAVLAHELAHLQRRDHWLARVELLLTAALFWHPLYWFARARMRLWAELACDAAAVQAVPGASLEYAEVLVDAAARPASPPTGVSTAILASRPSARAAFERRLKMILNQNLPRRASRAWLLPFAGLFVGLFALPVAAQDPDAREVRVEIRVNGKKVEGLSPAQRKALLELVTERDTGRKATDRAGRIVERARSGRPDRRQLQDVSEELRGLGGDLGDVADELRRGLAEARREIAADEDLRELGITDEVLEMIDGIADGKGIEPQLDGVLRAAMEGAGKIVAAELEADPDLKKLGVDRDLGRLVKGVLGDERNQRMVGEIARTALDEALREARREIRNDPDLKELGIAGDLERLVEGVIAGGGDLEGELQGVLGRALRSALPRAGGESERLPTPRRTELEDHEHELRQLERQLEEATKELERARARLEELRQRRVR